MFRTKLVSTITFFTLSLATGCLADETETIDPDPVADDLGRNDRNDDNDEPTEDNGCRLRKDNGELECPDDIEL